MHIYRDKINIYKDKLYMFIYKDNIYIYAYMHTYTIQCMKRRSNIFVKSNLVMINK